MFNEYDVVIAKVDLSEKVRFGCLGAVLMCFDGDDYEVEFVDSQKDTLEVLTVSGSNLVLQSEFESCLQGRYLQGHSLKSLHNN
ncbi:DUF4926 domain-containing protein [Marinagarivorans algicola]|uniref:DUF4926 domain-containing protein n=1 Tax=Marinagarivorans algicola TaxID=1513270 RepID=UPI003735E3F3